MRRRACLSSGAFGSGNQQHFSGALTAFQERVGGGSFGERAIYAGLTLIGLTLVLALLWALAVWSADRYIARARVEAGTD